MTEHEGQRLEFRLDWNDSAKKTAVAFANSGGGSILVGVDDVDGRMLRVMQSIGNGIRPDSARFTSIRASEAAILSMIRESTGLSFEGPRSVEQGLTFDAAKSEFAGAGVAFDDGAMRTLGPTAADEHTVSYISSPGRPRTA